MARLRTLLHNGQFLHATAVLVGTMVGVGVFSIPLVFAKAGVVVGLVHLLFAGAITLLTNLLFAEVVLRTHQPHQLVGYAGRYLGTGAKRIMLLTNTLGIYGAFLVYIIAAGDFFHNIFSSAWVISPWIYSVGFAVIVGGLLFRSFKIVAAVEFFMTGLFIAVMSLIIVLGVRHIEVTNWFTVQPSFWFLPYGVLLFAFGGLTSIPIQRQILEGHEHWLRPAIWLAVGVVAVLYVLFALTVVGIAGDATPPDALSGLGESLGSWVVVASSVFGVLAISTSFLMLGTALKGIFQLDYRLSKFWAWFLVAVPPVLLFAIGVREAVRVISLVGSVAIGIESLVLILLYHHARREGNRIPEMTVSVPHWVLVCLPFLFGLGVIYAIFFE